MSVIYLSILLHLKLPLNDFLLQLRMLYKKYFSSIAPGFSQGFRKYVK